MSQGARLAARARAALERRGLTRRRRKHWVRRLVRATREAGHRWDLCRMCGPTVLCGVCGNNLCNGGRGEVDGRPCPSCPDAWAMANGAPPADIAREWSHWHGDTWVG